MLWTPEERRTYEELKQNKYGSFTFRSAMIGDKLVKYAVVIPNKLWVADGSSRYIVRIGFDDENNWERQGTLVCDCMAWRVSGYKRVCKHTKAIVKNGDIDFHALVDVMTKRAKHFAQSPQDLVA